MSNQMHYVIKTASETYETSWQTWHTDIPKADDEAVRLDLEHTVREVLGQGVVSVVRADGTARFLNPASIEWVEFRFRDWED
jgi:hypothetical protein